MKKERGDSAEYSGPTPSLGSLFEGITEPPPIVVEVPRIDATPAPAAAGSKSSQRAAELAAADPFRRDSWRAILLVLGANASPISLARLSERTGLAINVVCARVSELKGQWIDVVDGACESDAKPGLRVDGLQLTAAGRARVRGAAA